MFVVSEKRKIISVRLFFFWREWVAEANTACMIIFRISLKKNETHCSSMLYVFQCANRFNCHCKMYVSNKIKKIKKKDGQSAE